MNVVSETQTAAADLDDEFLTPGEIWECDRCECPGRYLMDLTFLEINDTVLLLCPGCKDDLIVEGLLTFTAHTLFENCQQLPEG